MPLILISGFPCSGKTFRTLQILEDFENRIAEQQSSKRSIVHVPSQHAQHDDDSERESKESLRNTIYNSSALEKNARASEFSAVKRAVNKDCVVITDAPNYIKGYRYQLWCEAKAVGTRCVVVHVASREDECKRWNDMRRKNAGEEVADEEEQEEIVEKGQYGRDAWGDLKPEGHTAIYGDRPTIDRRSSSTDGRFEDDEDIIKQKPNVDTMTLKSLYIGDRSKGRRSSAPIADAGENASSDSLPPAKDARSNSIQITESQTIEYSASDTNIPSSPSAKPIVHTLISAPSTALLTRLSNLPPYTPSTLHALTMRFEPPSPFSRWDRPLFTIPSSDSHPDYDAIWDAIFPPPTKRTVKVTGREEEKRAEDVRPHAATVVPKASGPEALQVLEKVTSEVVSQLMAWGKRHNEDNAGGTCQVEVTDENERTCVMDVEVAYGVVIALPMLQRHRRRFVQIQRVSVAHGQGYARGRKAIAEAFGRFLEGELGE